MRLIDVDALMVVLEKIPAVGFKNIDNQTYTLVLLAQVLNIIKQQPTIEERKKGKWIPVTRIYKVTEEQFPNTHIEWVDATEPDEIDGVRCSECDTVYDFIEARNWCSECGADMRGEGHETD